MGSPVEIRGGHGGDGELSVLEVPSSYHRVAGLAGQRDAAGYAVAHAYPVPLRAGERQRHIPPLPRPCAWVRTAVRSRHGIESATDRRRRPAPPHAA
jgi:hypothetical protein